MSSPCYYPGLNEKWVWNPIMKLVALEEVRSPCLYGPSAGSEVWNGGGRCGTCSWSGCGDDVSDSALVYYIQIQLLDLESNKV